MESRLSSRAMAKAHESWTVLDHGPLEALSDNLWRVEGAIPRMSLRRVMTVARLAGGGSGGSKGLVIHNAIAVDDPTRAALEALGTPAYLIVPNAYHRLDAPAFKARYPQLKVLCPKGVRTKVEEVIPVDGTYEDFPADDAVSFRPLAGIGDAEGAMMVRSADGVTAILNDVVFNMDTKKDPLGWLFTTLFGSAGGPRISRLLKLVMVKDKRALRADLQRLADTPGLIRLVVSHEKVASGSDAAAALRTAAGYL